MSDENKNLKDPERNPPSSYGAGTDKMSITISYNKANKLITALFMVTDILRQEEPLRNKLRTLGVEIISDIHSNPAQAGSKITQVMSFMDIALSINLVSQMNHNILVREFSKLAESISEYGKVSPAWLEEFLVNPPVEKSSGFKIIPPIGHASRTSNVGTRIGVQKGHTLLKAIKDISDKNSVKNNEAYDELKKRRRQDIVNVLKTNPEGLVITDIKVKSKGHEAQFPALASCSEKTLQRELVSMLKDGVLKKIGEKRWSRYSIL
jgi:hypothetical protein